MDEEPNAFLLQHSLISAWAVGEPPAVVPVGEVAVFKVVMYPTLSWGPPQAD